MSIAEINYGLVETELFDSEFDANVAFDRAEISNDNETLHIIRPVGELSCRATILTEDYMHNRYEYVKSENWLPGAVDDYDEYDVNNGTRYVIKSDESNEVSFQAGMRLTAIDDLEKSLTWNMMSKNPEMRYAGDVSLVQRLERSIEEKSAYDLTRLVFSQNNRASARSFKDVALDVFGAGIRATHEDDKDTAWYFLTTKRLSSYLGAIGICHETLTSDFVTPGDAEESVLCVARPQDVLDLTSGSSKIKDRYAYRRLSDARDSFTREV